MADPEERRARKKRRDRDDDDEPRRSRRGRRSRVPVAVYVVGGILLLGAVVFGVHKLLGTKSPLARKAPVPAGWQQFTSEKDGFRGYFPTEVTETPIKEIGTVTLDGRVLMELDSSIIYTSEDRSRGVSVRIHVMRYKGPVAPEAREELLKSQDDTRRMPPEMRREYAFRKITWFGRDAIDVSYPRARHRTVYLDRSLLTVEVGGPDNKRAPPEFEDGFFDNFELLK